MPELPEVETTVRGLKAVEGLVIKNVWTDYFKKTAHGHKQNLKNEKYAQDFIKKVKGKKILGAERIGKNVIINLTDNLSILTHMKMTGHYLYGNYRYFKKDDLWQPLTDGALKDSFNHYIHLVFSLSNNKQLVLSDVRKFAKVLLINTSQLKSHPDLEKLGPDPLDKKFSSANFKKRILSEKGPIKSVLMDQEVIAGVGNIYSDEMLWSVGIHPESTAANLKEGVFEKLYISMKEILKRSIKVGGDSTSDYRKIDGKRGGFQNEHQVYRKLGKKCNKDGCDGVISRIVVRGRSAHFCPVHQKKW